MFDVILRMKVKHKMIFILGAGPRYIMCMLVSSNAESELIIYLRKVRNKEKRAKMESRVSNYYYLLHVKYYDGANNVSKRK